jgi:hypothetical protein
VLLSFEGPGADQSKINVRLNFRYRQVSYVSMLCSATKPSLRPANFLTPGSDLFSTEQVLLEIGMVNLGTEHNHHGNTAAERGRAAQGFLLYWERAKDLTAVLDKRFCHSSRAG